MNNKNNNNEMLISLKAANVSNRTTSEMKDLLKVDFDNGLSEEEASERLRIYGRNEFQHEEDDPLWYKYISQFKEPMIILLLFSAFVSLCMRQFDDAVSITVAIIIVVTVAFVQEYRSEKALEALKQLMPPQCQCLRSGLLRTVMASDLVPGDIVVLNVGDKVPADIRLLEANELYIDESSFSGETEPVGKISEPLTFKTTDSDVQNHKIKNVAFMTTLVRCGSGKGVVVGTGENSEFGEIYKRMQSEEPPRTPLQQSMDTLGKQLSIISFAIIGVIIVVGLIQGRQLMVMFTIGVSLAVAAIPEGLPIVVTVTLAIGQFRMAKRNAIVKKLPAVETLGCVNVICSDKTGTLTKNEMTITEIISSGEERAQVSGIGYLQSGELYINSASGSTRTFNSAHDPVFKKIIEVGAVCNNATIKDGILSGQPTEGAFICLANKTINGMQALKHKYKRLKEWPFSSDTKWMAVKCAEHNSSNETVYFMKGAIERVLENCQFYYTASGEIQPLNPVKIKSIMAEGSFLGSQGMRVLAVAENRHQNNNHPVNTTTMLVQHADNASYQLGNSQRQHTNYAISSPDDKAAMRDMAFCGLVGILDPPKHFVKESIQLVQQSGVRVTMITGDSKDTACSIASSLGIYRPGIDHCLSGEQLDSIPQQNLVSEIQSVSVFYRTSPRHKSVIVKAFQSRQLIVAMTGDGVNDAVALKSADIGIAMGQQGTDVCKEAAGIVLANDDFSTIVAAMEEGKSIFHNIRNFVRFQLSTSIAALSLITLSTLFDLPSPLNAMQILWINILMDGPPAQSLGVEPADPEIIKQPPRRIRESIITRQLIVNVLISASCIVCGTMWIFHRELSDNKITPRDTTMTFTCFVLFDMFNALGCRSQKKSILTVGLFSNRVFLVSVGLSLLGQLLVIYLPPAQWIFQTEALYLSDIILLLCVSSTVFFVSELKKYIERNSLGKLKSATTRLLFCNSSFILSLISRKRSPSNDFV